MLLAALAVFAGPALAQAVSDERLSPTEGDVPAITLCLESRSPGFDPATCIGQIATACMATDANSTTMGMTACLAREQDAWDVLLNIEYNRALEGLEPAAAAALRRAQRHWLRQKASDLAVFAAASGTIQLIRAADYDMTATAQRVLFLRVLP